MLHNTPDGYIFPEIQEATSDWTNLVCDEAVAEVADRVKDEPPQLEGHPGPDGAEEPSDLSQTVGNVGRDERAPRLDQLPEHTGYSRQPPGTAWNIAMSHRKI